MVRELSNYGAAVPRPISRQQDRRLLLGNSVPGTCNRIRRPLPADVLEVMKLSPRRHSHIFREKQPLLSVHITLPVILA
jgi:hypothetical protein